MNDINELVKELISQVIEKGLEGEMDIDVPRDRKGEFEPQIIQKHQNLLSHDIEEKIISMYAKGMSTGDIKG
jgi:transposase-like protein